MRILLVKLGAIGDIVHALPALAAIRRELPGAEISWVVEERSAEILRGNPLIDNLIEIDTRKLRGGRVVEDMLVDAGKQLKGLRRYKFDVSIDLQGLWKSALVGKLSGAKRRWGFSRAGLREPGSRILLTDTVEVRAGTHIIRKNLTLAGGALGIDLSDAELEFPIETSLEDKAEADAILAGTNGRFAILNPAGGWVTKLWPAENYGRLADRLWDEHGMTSVLTTSKKEMELARRAVSASRSGQMIAATPGLKAFYELARRSSVYVGGDTGPTHLAVAAGAPVVGIFGPTEWWRNGSPREDDICVERNDIHCRVDCHRRTCSAWICMDVDVATVAAAVAARMSVGQTITV